MSETPFQFQYQGQVAGLRTDPLPVLPNIGQLARGTVEVPYPRGRWIWFAAAVMGVAAAVLWWVGMQNPAVSQEVSVAEEIAPISEGPIEISTASVAPSIVVIPAATATTNVPLTSTLKARIPSRARRWKQARGESPVAVVASISLVRASGGAPASTANVRSAVNRVLGKLQACSQPLMQRDHSLKGTVRAAFTARSGRVTAVTVDSAIRDPALRWCFRKTLMALPIPGERAGFDGHLEFFLVPRIVR